MRGDASLTFFFLVVSFIGFNKGVFEVYRVRICSLYFVGFDSSCSSSLVVVLQLAIDRRYDSRFRVRHLRVVVEVLSNKSLLIY